ncbi:hypothetical protein C7S18_01500 [Ahniella affigens]|uniref:Uncharacterized protein n=1 Tax=Ahniella affigens TaxID=2021234 RepID=A0A2P1PM80_9GAMM|nr:hypothetical protein [Ahniella affigens]AVP95951.1 hypothetical protein C7S18_01500 [Ahniella affigens]
MSETTNDPVNTSTLIAALQHVLDTGQQLPVLQYLGRPSEESNPEDRIREAIRVLRSGGQLPVLANLDLAQQINDLNLEQWMTIDHQYEMNQVLMATMAKAVSLLVGGDGEDHVEPVGLRSEIRRVDTD